MRDYIYQFYNEGLATTFCLKPIDFIKKIVKNKFISDMLIMLVRIIYTIFILWLAWKIFWIKYPL